MSSIVIAGLDPALRNLGMAKGLLDMETGRLSNVEIKLSRTVSAAYKVKGTRKNSQDLERVRTLHADLTEFLKDVDIVVAEMPVGSQSSRSMASYGICIGLMAGIKVPLIQVTAAEVKAAAGGPQTASKAFMIQWATELWPKLPWIKNTRKGVTALSPDNEHLADALAALKAGVNTEQFRQIRAIYVKPDITKE